MTKKLYMDSLVQFINICSGLIEEPMGLDTITLWLNKKKTKKTNDDATKGVVSSTLISI